MTERLYKWLLPGGVTPVAWMTWPVPVGVWTPDATPVICESGWHAMYERDVLVHLPATLGAELWEVEVRGAVVEGATKIAASSMRLVSHLGTIDESNLRLFACDVADDVLSIYESAYPGDKRPRTAIKVARRYALGDATAAELRAAAAAAGEAAATAAEAATAARGRYSNRLVVRLESGY